jgi:FkbM family methyltransferase
MISKKYGVSFCIKNGDDLNIITEVFDCGAYDISLNGSAVLIDIGFNIGAASVFFAKMPNIECIYSYEPFQKTYEQGLYNLELNPGLADKITVYPYGLSDANKNFEMPYSPKAASAMTVIPQNIEYIERERGLNEKSMSKTSVELKNAAEEISCVIAKHSGKKIILKMDCEGSEYAIMQSLTDKGILKNISAILLEYHFKGSRPILDVLEKNNFISFIKGNSRYGMIYSVRQ